MKKLILMPIVFCMLIMIATSVSAATTTLVERIYTKGHAYGVTTDHKTQMQRYFTNNPTTPEEDDYILTKVDECIAIMDKAGVKNVRQLSDADLKKVKALVQDAAKKIGLTVTFVGSSEFTVSKNGKSISRPIPLPGSSTSSSASNSTSSSSKKFVYTGSNSTLALSSVAIAVVALGTVIKLRKNA